MRHVVSVGFAVLVVAVALAAWAFTVGPWGPWQWRTVATERPQLT